MPADPSQHLVDHARRRHRQTLDRAQQTLTEMADASEPVTVARLAQRRAAASSGIA